ncbi:MAG: hypothetical protein AMS24_00810 [Chlamydiae bacterium SM23_39]|nr:MAG: hypothetical protein AMS24_00810 [Chlamydiae bacterium SM23_39]
MNPKNTEFNKFRSFFWPIHKHELIKFVPMLFLFFFVAFNYHLLRIVKDTLIITAPKGGAETLPFLKVWCILPFAIFMTFLFTKLSNKFNREKIFYMFISIFLIFYLIFIIFLYPKRDVLALNRTADYLTSILPKGFNGFVAIIRYWCYSLFYIMAECWSTIVVSVLLWGFANDTIKVPEAKRFYALFGLGINSAGIFAGQTVSLITKKNINLVSNKYFQSSWDNTLLIIISIILIFGVISMIIHRWLHKNIFQNRQYSNEQKDYKMSLKKNITFIFKSRYLLSIALIVLSYNVIINLTEILWKSQLRELFPTPQQYTSYMSKITILIGILASISSYFVSGNVIRRLGWGKAAMITPLIIILTAIGFFSFLFSKQFLSSFSIFGMSSLTLCVFFGSTQNIFSRACKYTLFDDTKEIAFIPLSTKDKIKGKSAIDGIGSRLGKSGSSFIIQLLLMMFITPAACSPVIAVLILIIIPIWISSISVINKNFQTTQSKIETI